MHATPSNLSLVTPLTADVAVDVLKTRYSQRLPYTLSSDQVLVAINPLQDLGLNGRRSWTMHDNNDISAQPHVYSISSCVQKRFPIYDTQAVFCCGESGSGKTESAKLILEHFTSNSPDNKSSQIVLWSNPVLEAFGNAATEANANSSRFGKVLTLKFANNDYYNGESSSSSGGGGGSYDLRSCQIQTFLFERSRVCRSTNEKERNFHIFYQLLAAPKTWLDEAGIDPTSESFQLLNLADRRDIRNDADDFESTLEGLAAIGVQLPMQKRIACMLGAILRIGEYQGSSGGKDEQASAAASVLLGTSELGAFFAQRSVTVRGETIWIKNTQEQQIQLRDLLCKELYLVVFEYILRTINSATPPPPPGNATFAVNKDKTCYLVDIMGFECLSSQANSIEQLLINYANEKMFDLFVSTQISAVEEEYAREGISFPPRLLDSASACTLLSLFDSSAAPHGLWRLLESEGKTPGGSDGGFVRKLKTSFPEKVELEKRSNSTKFSITHFAGRVQYDAAGFLEKSLHRTCTELTHLLERSTLVQSFTMVDSIKAAPSKSQTIGTMFQREIHELITTLRAVDKISWIRCIRPSASGGAAQFDEAYVKQQLVQSGILNAIQISRSALPIRLPLHEFISLSNYYAGTDSAIEQGDEVKFGKTLVYLTDALFQKLYQSKREHFAVLKLQSTVRIWLAKREFLAFQRCASKLQDWWRKVRDARIRAARQKACDEGKRSVAQLVGEFEESKVIITTAPAPAAPVQQHLYGWEDVEDALPLPPTMKQHVAASSSEDLERRARDEEMIAHIARLEALVEEKDRELMEQRKRNQREVKDLNRRIQELQREVVRLRSSSDDGEEEEEQVRDEDENDNHNRVPPPSVLNNKPAAVLPAKPNTVTAERRVSAGILRLFA